MVPRWNISLTAPAKHNPHTDRGIHSSRVTFQGLLSEPAAQIQEAGKQKLPEYLPAERHVTSVQHSVSYCSIYTSHLLQRRTFVTFCATTFAVCRYKILSAWNGLCPASCTCKWIRVWSVWVRYFGITLVNYVFRATVSEDDIKEAFTKRGFTIKAFKFFP